MRLLGADGAVRWIEAQGISMRNATGRPVVVGVLLDRTEQRQTQAREASLLSELARRERASLFGELTSVLAEALRRPLAEIASHSAWGLASLGEGSESEESLRAIGAEAARAIDIVDNVIDAAPPEPVRREPVDVLEVATRVARLVDLEARVRGVKVRVQREVEAAWTIGNPDQRPAQVLSNLLRNGLEAIAEHGAATGELTLSIAAGAPGWLGVSVHDSGKGVPGRPGRGDLRALLHHAPASERARSHREPPAGGVLGRPALGGAR